jgi:CubicO group peptidase (beta-lactamase class C family)
MVAQELVQRYSKQSFTDFVSARIFKPLNMSSTTYSLAFFNESGRGSEAWASFGRRIPHWLTDGDQGLIAGAGGIMSTTKDLVQWVKLLVGAINGTEIGIPETILQTCMSAQSLVATGVSYGFGWAQQEYRGIDSPVSSRVSVIELLFNVYPRLCGTMGAYPARRRSPRSCSNSRLL